MTDTEGRLRSLENDRLVILATMATKADLADLRTGLRGEIHAVQVDLIRWMVGVCLTILLFVVGFGLTLVNIALQILSRLPEPHA